MGTRRYRYPGLNYFRKEDEPIFCGRKEDAEKLYVKLMLNKTLVLHADSGTGKSSLIQAGLLPIMEEKEQEFREHLSFTDKKHLPYIPVTVRFDMLKKTGADEDKTPAEKEGMLAAHAMTLISESQPDLVHITLPYLENVADSLWVLAKKMARKGQRLLLIFDQFEELQSYNVAQVRHLKKELQDLLSSSTPQQYHSEAQKTAAGLLDREHLSGKEKEAFSANIKFLDASPEAKVLFVVREDKLGTMTLLSDFFPDILKNDFVLNPLTIDNARKAIADPAQAKGNYVSPPFVFENEQIVENLLQEIADNETRLIDPIQIQIICSIIEKKVIRRKQDKKHAPGERIMVSAADIPPIGDIINDFYNNCWDKVKAQLRKEKADYSGLEQKRKMIISELVVNDHRNLVHTDLLIDKNDAANDTKIIRTLVSMGLLRQLPSGKDTYYQLCHDRFIRPVNEDMLQLQAREKTEAERLKAAEDALRLKQELEKHIAQEEVEKENLRLRAKLEKKKAAEKVRKSEELEKSLKAEEVRRKLENERSRRNLIILGCISFTILVCCVLLIYNNRRTALARESQQVLTVARLTRKENPQLSFLAAQKWYSRHRGEKDFNKFLAEFNHANTSYAYQTGCIPGAYSAVDVALSPGNKQITVTGRSSISYWNINNQELMRQSVLPQGIYLKKCRLRSGTYFLVQEGDSLLVRNEKGVTEQKFPSLAQAEHVDLSKDGRYILIGQTIYNRRTGMLAGDITAAHPEGSVQTAAIFLNDGIHIAAGYWNGDKVIYRIDGQGRKKLRISAIYKPYRQAAYSAITSLAIDSKDSLLVAGNRQNDVEIWRLDSLSHIDALDEARAQERLRKSQLTREPYKVLKGHENAINHIAVSPNDSLVLSGSSDHTAILWEVATGKKLTVLKGRDNPLTYTGFSEDGKTMITASEDGIVTLWSREKPELLYRENRLTSLSPLDYYNAGLGRNDAFTSLLFDTASVKKLYKATLNYIISMPTANQHPGDIEYMDNLTFALAEIEGMYKSLRTHKDFKKDISMQDRKILYKYYNNMQLYKPDMLGTENETYAEKLKRYAQHHIDNTEALLIDTMDIATALGHSTDFTLVALYYFDSTSKPLQCFFYLEKANQLIDAFVKKYPEDTRLGNEQLTNYARIVYRNLRLHRIPAATEAAGRLSNIKNGAGWADLFRIQIYLLDGHYGEAMRLYLKTREMRIPDIYGGQPILLKEQLKFFLENLRNYKITSEAAAQFLVYLDKKGVQFSR